MGLIMDVVPNHMCIASSDNHWWNDVLENGRSSPYAAVLRHRLAPAQDRAAREGAAAGARRAVRPRAGEPGDLHRRLRGRRVLRPLLRVALSRSGRARSCRCSNRSSPTCAAAIRADHPDVLEIESIVTATKHLPTRWDTEPEQGARAACAKRRSSSGGSTRWCRAAPPCATRWSAACAAINGDEGQPAQLRPAGGAARRSGVPPELLGRRRRGDQLPPLLRHQRPGRHPRRGAEGARRRSRQGVPAAARGQGDRPAHRPRRRPAATRAATSSDLQRACAAAADGRGRRRRTGGRRACRPTSSSRRS